MNTIEKELTEAREKYGAFNSTHEAYAVLIEEVNELWDVIKEKNKAGNDNSIEALEKKQKMIHELIQIAAIAQRTIEELENNQIKWI
jgi:hypothetical protein